MQLITKRTNILIATVLSCSILLASFGVYDELSNMVNTRIARNHVSIQPSSEPSLDAAQTSNHVTSIWDTIRDDLKLDHQSQSSRVKAEIHKLLADQDKLYKILQAAGPYLYFIMEQTKHRGLPAELALIPVIESEFNPNDHSNKGATGLWQLMPGTAHELGIKVQSSYDGRRNVIASTKAALAYFNDLGVLFDGNWYLALAAYNCGQGKITSAERRTGSHSFWNLPLPQETKYYVPKLLAVAEIIKNPEAYGVSLPPISNEPYFAQVKVKKSVNLDQLAKSTGVSPKTLHTLNPDFNHGMEKVKGSYTLLVPVKKLNVVLAQLQGNVIV